MKALIAIVLTLALGWSGYWFVGSRYIVSEAEERLRIEPALDVRYSDISVRGFPNRFDVTFSDLEVADLQSGFRWEAQFFQVLALSYDWTHLIAVFPPTQSISIGTEKFTIASSGMRASVETEIFPEIEPERITFESGRARILNSNRVVASISDSIFAVQRQEAEPDVYRIGISVPMAELVETKAGGSASSSNFRLAVTNLLGDLRVGFGAPPRIDELDRLESRISEISVDRLGANLNGIGVAAGGGLEIAASGHPVGELTLEVESEQAILNLAIASGFMSRLQADLFLLASPLLSKRGSKAGAIRIPIQYKEGLTFLQGTRIGPAWRLARE